MAQLDTISAPTAPAKPGVLERALFVLAMLALALAPTQLTVNLKVISLTPAEVTLLAAAAVWAVRWLWVRDTRSLPPLTVWVFLLAGALSLVGMVTDAEFLDAGEKMRSAVTKGFALDLAKIVLYLLLGLTVFRAAFTTPQRIRTAVIALLATTSLAVLLAVVQRGVLQARYQPDPGQRLTFVLAAEKEEAEDPEDVNPREQVVASRYAPQVLLTAETPVDVSSTFGSWNTHGYHASRTAYAGFLALVLPFALALLIRERKRLGIVVWLSLFFLGTAVSVLAGYLLPAMLLGLMVTGVALGARTGRAVLIGIAAYLLLLAIVGGHNRTEVLQEPYRLTVSAAEAAYRYDGVAHLKKFWGEQQAALNLLASDPVYAHRNPLFGVGLGQYQAKINQTYDTLGLVSNQRLESDAQNGYLLIAVTTGLLGLAALLALFGTHLGQAWRLVRCRACQPWSAALLGAMVALLVMTLGTNSLVRGTFVVIVALLAILGNYAGGVVREESDRHAPSDTADH